MGGEVGNGQMMIVHPTIAPWVMTEVSTIDDHGDMKIRDNCVLGDFRFYLFEFVLKLIR